MGARKPELVRVVRVSDERLEKIMGIAQKVVDAVDERLLDAHVGAFEVISLYLTWASNPDSFEEKIGVDLRGHKRHPADRFQNVLGGLLGTGPGTEYVNGLADFVRTL